MIRFQYVSKRYANGYLALDNANFELKAGEFAFLTGHSGAGKSTLLKLIAAIEPTTQGNITVGEYHLNRLAARDIPFLRRQIGIISQTPELLMDRSVFDNVALPLIIAGHHFSDMQSRVRAVLAKVSLQNKEKCFPFELSTGEQQRIAIARAIINKPRLLLADEPTGNLDPNLAAEMMHLFEQFNSLGMTILIASHDLALVNQLKHRVLRLTEGKLLCES
jgi:cell division transport system ATP-binding protein